MLQLFDFARRTITGKDDLLVTVMQGVEGMEEFLLRAFLACQKLDVVDHQDIRIAIFLAELHQCAVLDGIDELIGKLLTGKVNDAGGFWIVDYEVADCLEQVCLAQSASSVHEKGIEGLRGRLGHRDGGSVSELVVRADDEGPEGVPKIKPGRCLVLSARRGNCPGERGLRVGKRRQKRFSELSRAGSDELDIPGTAEH